MTPVPEPGDALEVLDPAAARAELSAVAHGWQADGLGPLAGRPLLVVDLDGPGPDDLPRPDPLPCVIVGVSSQPGPPQAPAACDVLLSDAPDPPPPWVGCGGQMEVALAGLHERIAHAPAAACILSQLLRTSEALPLPAALVAESLAYSTLQAGPEFARWLAGRPVRTPPAETGDAVVVHRRNGMLRVVLNRPVRRNAFNAAMRDGLVAALEVAAADPSVTEVRLEGEGPAFCSGGDLDEFGTLPDPATAHLIRTTRSAGAQIARLRERTVAVLHGACVGAGIELPAFAGRVIADAGTRLMLPEVAMGLVPGAGGTASIPRRIGRQRCAWLALSGEWLDAPTARRWGLVDEIAP